MDFARSLPRPLTAQHSGCASGRWDMRVLQMLLMALGHLLTAQVTGPASKLPGASARTSLKRKRQGLQHKLRKVHVQAGRSLLEELIGKEEIWDSDDELEAQSIEQASAKAKQDADLRRRQLEPRGRGRPRTEDVDAELAQLAKWRPDGTIDDSLFDTSPRDERGLAPHVLENKALFDRFGVPSDLLLQDLTFEDEQAKKVSSEADRGNDMLKLSDIGASFDAEGGPDYLKEEGDEDEEQEMDEAERVQADFDIRAREKWQQERAQEIGIELHHLQRDRNLNKFTQTHWMADIMGELEDEDDGPEATKVPTWVRANMRMERDWKKLEQHVKEQEVVSELDLMAYETADIEQEMDIYGDLDPFAEEEEDWDPLARFTDGILPNVTNEDIEDMLQDPVARMNAEEQQMLAQREEEWYRIQEEEEAAAELEVAAEVESRLQEEDIQSGLDRDTWIDDDDGNEWQMPTSLLQDPVAETVGQTAEEAAANLQQVRQEQAGLLSQPQEKTEMIRFKGRLMPYDDYVRDHLRRPYDEPAESRDARRAAIFEAVEQQGWTKELKRKYFRDPVLYEVNDEPDEVDDEYNMVEEEAEFDLENLPSKWWEDLPGEDILGSLTRQREEQMASQMVGLSVNEVGLDIDEDEDEDED
eukprot:jgi/Astpho2/9420/Aster-01681